MWTCPSCHRGFQRNQQIHSCRRVSVDSHFQNKPLAKDIFTHLLDQIHQTIGPCKVVSLPCCIHLFGNYDFLAALPKKDHLEIRFALNHPLHTPKLKVSVPLSSASFKHCFDVYNIQQLDDEFLNWLKESYLLKT